MAFTFNHQPTGIGGAMTSAAQKVEEDKRRQAAIAFMLQQMGLKNELSLGTEQNRISAARQSSDATNDAARVALEQQRQEQGNAISQQQLAQEQKRIQQAYEQQHNAISMQNANRLAQGPTQGGLFGLQGTSRYQQSLQPRSVSAIRGGIH